MVFTDVQLIEIKGEKSSETIQIYVRVCTVHIESNPLHEWMPPKK